MTTPNAETSVGSAINPADNPSEWIEARIKRDAEPTSSTGQSDTQASPAQPTVAASPETVQPTSWRDTVIGDDVDHGFFKGKKVADAIESYKHAERAKQEAERRANDLQRQLEAERIERQTELVARKVIAEQQQRSAEPKRDPLLAEIEQNWFENPARAMELIEQRAAAQQRQIAAEEASRIRQETEKQAQERYVATTGEQAFYAARDFLKVDPETWDKRGVALLSTVTRQGSKYAEAGGPLNPNVMVQAYKDLFGEPVQAENAYVAAPAQPIATPPGSNKPARAAMPNSAPTSPLAQEERIAYELAAKSAGLDVDRFIKRRERRA